MVSKKELNQYINRTAVNEVLGSLIVHPELIREFKLTTNDFTETFHKLIYGTINNLSKNGVKTISSADIDDYLSHYETQYILFKKNNGIEYIERIVEACEPVNAKYYYEQLKKFTLLRRYLEHGIDVSEFYDPQEINPKAIEEKREYLDKCSCNDIINHYKKMQLEITAPFLIGEGRDSKKAGVGGREQKERWKKSTAWGLGYASAYLTTVTHGLRTKRFTVKSAGSGVGKTRTSLSDLCYCCVPKYYDSKKQVWCENPNGTFNGGLYIGTEMELLEEIDPILWAYIADVPQEHIEYNTYEEGEEERVDEAIRILEEEANIWLEYVPQYDVNTLESVIEEHKIKHGIKYVWFDYIHATAELVSEYSAQINTRMSVREDQVLAALSTQLKNICRTYDISLNTCTQVSGDFRSESNRDETIVRGARAIIDKADVAMIAMPPTKVELKRVEPILRRMLNKRTPNLVYSLYKNRGGKFKKVKIWLYVEYDTMRVHDLFITDYEDKLIDEIGKTYISIHKKEKTNTNGEKEMVVEEQALNRPTYKPIISSDYF